MCFNLEHRDVNQPCCVVMEGDTGEPEMDIGFGCRHSLTQNSIKYATGSDPLLCGISCHAARMCRAVVSDPQGLMVVVELVSCRSERCVFDSHSPHSPPFTKTQLSDERAFFTDLQCKTVAMLLVVIVIFGECALQGRIFGLFSSQLAVNPRNKMKFISFSCRP